MFFFPYSLLFGWPCYFYTFPPISILHPFWNIKNGNNGNKALALKPFYIHAQLPRKSYLLYTLWVTPLILFSVEGIYHGLSLISLGCKGGIVRINDSENDANCERTLG